MQFREQHGRGSVSTSSFCRITFQFHELSLGKSSCLDICAHSNEPNQVEQRYQMRKTQLQTHYTWMPGLSPLNLVVGLHAQ